MRKNILMNNMIEIIKAVTMKTTLPYNEEFYRKYSYDKYHKKVKQEIRRM